ATGEDSARAPARMLEPVVLDVHERVYVGAVLRIGADDPPEVVEVGGIGVMLRRDDGRLAVTSEGIEVRADHPAGRWGDELNSARRVPEGLDRPVREVELVAAHRVPVVDDLLGADDADADAEG